MTLALHGKSRRHQRTLLATAFLAIGLAALGALLSAGQPAAAGKPEDIGVLHIKKVVVDEATDTTAYSGTVIKAQGNQFIGAFADLVQGFSVTFPGLANGTYDVTETETTLIGYWKADGEASCPGEPSALPNQNKAVISNANKVVTVCVYNQLEVEVAGENHEQEDEEVETQGDLESEDEDGDDEEDLDSQNEDGDTQGDLDSQNEDGDDEEDLDSQGEEGDDQSDFDSQDEGNGEEELLVTITETPGPATETPVTDEVAGESDSTLERAPAPAPPSTGTGLRAGDSSFNMVLALLGLAFLATGGTLILAERKALK